MELFDQEEKIVEHDFVKGERGAFDKILDVCRIIKHGKKSVEAEEKGNENFEKFAGKIAIVELHSIPFMRRVK